MLSPVKYAGRISAAFMLLALVGCSPPEGPNVVEENEEETLSRTEFTDRIENFFEYDALTAGEPSQFLIHLSKLDVGPITCNGR